MQFCRVDGTFSSKLNGTWSRRCGVAAVFLRHTTVFGQKSRRRRSASDFATEAAGQEDEVVSHTCRWIARRMSIDRGDAASDMHEGRGRASERLSPNLPSPSSVRPGIVGAVREKARQKS